MRKILFLLVLCATGLLSKTSFAQVNVRFNIESQPIWGPAGYNYVEYYYLPEIETYYYVPTRKYVYFENNRWITRSYLPRRYSNYNMYNAHKVVINERSPYLRHKSNKVKYASSGAHYRQLSIRDSKEPKYNRSKPYPNQIRRKEAPKNYGQSKRHGKGGKHK